MPTRSVPIGILSNDAQGMKGVSIKGLTLINSSINIVLSGTFIYIRIYIIY